MSVMNPLNVRTLALVGAAGAGKTTLIEALLAATGSISSAGSVEKGTTVCDYEALEKEHGHSLKLATAHFEQDGVRVHLLDTPGYPDFTGQAMCALDAVETVAVVVDATRGIDLIATRMMQWAQTRKLVRMVIVSKMDAPGVDATTLAATLAEIQAAFGRECLPINLPAAGASQVTDCFFNLGGEADFSSVAEAHQALVDQVVEVDEDLMAVYLDQGTVSPEQLHAPLEQALREGHLVPVCFTSARSGAGVAALIDAILRLLPNPTEGNPPRFVRGEGEMAQPFTVTADPGQPVLAHCFKVEIDPYVGRIALLRVYQGTLTLHGQLFVGEGRRPFKVGHLHRVQGKQLTPAEACGPGEICAISKVDDIHFDDVLHDAAEDEHIHMQPLDFPHAVFGLALRARKQSDAQKLADVLHRLCEADPGLHVEHDAQTHEAVIRGLGEMHLKHVLEKMYAQFKLEVDTHPPSIPYRETLTQSSEGHCRHKKQTGGAGQFGEVYLRVEPLERGAGFEFVDAVKGGAIPGTFIPAVEKGVRMGMAGGAVAGFPLQDVRVTVYDGKTHPVDGKEIAFVMAGKKAFWEAMAGARPVVLEPFVQIEVSLPEACIGDIGAEITSRRGHILGNQPGRGGMSGLTGMAPLAELENFQARLKAVTSGQGAYSLTFSHYDPVPPQVQQQLSAGFKRHEED
jgi:elongation factor G